MSVGKNTPAGCQNNDAIDEVAPNLNPVLNHHESCFGIFQNPSH
jgi:hypothetical protein